MKDNLIDFCSRKRKRYGENNVVLCPNQLLSVIFNNTGKISDYPLTVDKVYELRKMAFGDNNVC